MMFKSRVTNGLVVGLALGAAFGAGYSTHSRYPEGWRWPENGSPKRELVRTASGNALAQSATSNAGKERSYKPDLRPYETLDEVRRAIKDNFVRTKVDDTELTYGAVRGMLRSLDDRFTRFMTPDDYKNFQVSNRGEFVGIGARIDLKEDYLGSPQARPIGASRPYIVDPIPGGPAEKIGLKRGDIILAIDGKSTADMGEDATVSHIRGERGTPVKLKIERQLNQPKDPKEIKWQHLDLNITRDTIEMHPVELEWIPGEIAWLKLTEFNEKTDAEMGAALAKIKSGHNGKATKGLILDMRSNPGGLLTAAVDVGSRFIQSGPVVITKERDGNEKTLSADGKRFSNLKVPIVVLVDGYSASASEIVAGALKDLKKATLVGETTFGKASVQVLVDLKNGGALVLTTAKYFTPSHKDISDKGVVPDIKVEASEQDLKDGRGAQLQKAIDIIREKSATVTARAN